MVQEAKILLMRHAGALAGWLAILGLGLLAYVLLSASRRHWVIGIFRRKMGLPLVLSGAGFLFTLYPSPKGLPIVFYLALGSIGLTAALLAANALGVRPGFRTAIGALHAMAVRLLFRTPRAGFLIAAFVISFGLMNLCSLACFEHIPHVPDSIDQLFHARILAMGRLTAPAPVPPEFFEFEHVIIREGKWYSQYPPGHSALLALGVLTGTPWLVNPLLGALTIVLVYMVGRELYGERTGRLACILAVVSPFILFMSSEFMNHTTALCAFSLFLLGFARAVKRGSAGYGAVAGAAAGWLVNTRPFSSAVLLPFAVYALVALVRDFRLRWRPLAAMAAVGLLFVALLLGFNTATNGRPLLFGYEALWGPGLGPGFGHSAWGPPHTPRLGLIQTLDNLNALNRHLFEWPVPSLAFVFILFATATRNRWDYLLLASFVMLAAFYFFYWYQDRCFGPRFLYEAATPLILLTARGVLRLPVLLRHGLAIHAPRLRVRQMTTLAIVVSLIAMLAGPLPYLLATYSRHFYSVDASILKAVERAGIRQGLVFVGPRFASVFAANRPLLDGGVIFARDLGDRNGRLEARYPGYPCYVVEGSRLSPVRRADARSGPEGPR